MRVGMVGCGKLGLMLALTMESRGHEVMGYDVSDAPARYLAAREIPFQEEHADTLLPNTRMRMVPLKDLCEWADILFLAPQTPHGAEFEGVTPLPAARADFDYRYLKSCVEQVNACLVRPTVCVVVSTVLPGTLGREVTPTISRNFRLVYSPQFIAMGTVYSDFLNPEFWLIGVDDSQAAAILDTFYSTIATAPVVQTDVTTAEGIKVLYNTFITTKTVLANLYGEMAHKLGMNVDDIHRAVSLSTRRLLSPRYLRAGCGDGGGCHPRDNIALSYLARQERLSFDFFEALMLARQRHCEWLADLIEQNRGGLPVILLGRSFKPESNIETGSSAKLLSNILTYRHVEHLHVEDLPTPLEKAALYFISTQHVRYRAYSFPAGSVVIDPFRYIPAQPSVTLIPIGGPTRYSALLGS